MGGKSSPAPAPAAAPAGRDGNQLPKYDPAKGGTVMDQLLKPFADGSYASGPSEPLGAKKSSDTVTTNPAYSNSTLGS
jgi:hypothetical protein